MEKNSNNVNEGTLLRMSTGDYKGQVGQKNNYRGMGTVTPQHTGPSTT